MNDGSAEKENPLLAALKAKILPEKETNDAVTGYLYFIFDGKLPKVKDLTMVYKSTAGRVMLDFAPHK